MEHKDNVLLRVTFKAFPELGKLNVVESGGIEDYQVCKKCALYNNRIACEAEGVSRMGDCISDEYHYTKAE